MNILVVAAHGLYESYSASFVHNQIKEYVRAGHAVRAVVPVAIGKKTAEYSRFSLPVVEVVHDGVEICYVRYLSLSAKGQHTFNPLSAEKAVCANMDRILRGFSPDIIHAHAILFGGRIGVQFKKRCGVPLVITTHGGDTRLSVTEAQISRAKKICDAADCVVGVSQTCRDTAMRIGSSTPTECIFNGFDGKNAVSRGKLPHSIIQVGHLNRQKHADYTIKAVSELINEYPDIVLTFVGAGPEEENLKELCRECRIEKNVVFTGFLPNKDAMEKMAGSEIFILPSTAEGFGIVYLEAMASGCVTIGTEGEGIDGVIVNGETGYLVKPDDVKSIADTVRYCFDNPAAAKKAAENGKKLARTLTWEKNAGKYLKIFEKLI